MLCRLIALYFLSVSNAEMEYKGRYTRELKGYEVVVPKKVSEDGVFVSYHLPHFYNAARVQRGVDSGKINYAVPIEGEDKILELLPTEDFYAPGTVVEHHVKDARFHIDSVKIRKPRLRRCYYQGWVRNEPDSSTAITTCTGLAGSIRLRKENYLIEPIDEEGRPTVDVKHRHLLYKRSDQRVFANRSSCGTTTKASVAFKRRMEWEAKYGKQVEESMKGVLNHEKISDYNGKMSLGKIRHERFCSTCHPSQILKCFTPHAPCSTDMPLFVELLIVVGPRVAETAFVDEDVEQYVNTVINIAVRHFQDSSLGRPILVKLVRVITMGFLYDELDPKKHNPQGALRNFCNWQTHFNPRLEDHPNHHDFAIYLVKFESCHGSIIGLTNVASMCRPDRACAVVSEEGLLTGHIITHMLGHSLGAEHDDSSTSSCCPEEPDGTAYHMGTEITSRSTAWSYCSKQSILQFVKTHAGWCLTDSPTITDLTDPVILPGQIYSAAEQCRINFEIETCSCIVGEFCKRLFCKINEKECVSTGDPPAQGTQCGPDKWCFNQRCVHRGSRPGATNGEWGAWSSWSTCTKTCGGGIQTAHRACDTPAPSQGGRLCPGNWLKSRMCNVGSCPDAGKGFLDMQCELTNDRPYHGRKHEWMYYNRQIEDLQCVVVCVNERNEVAVRSPLAIDGTFCKPGYKDVCIRGTCKEVGCDWGIGSHAKEDACGICHGNGTECRIMQGYFGDRNVKGTIEFLKLPIGTSMVLVRETRPSSCYFMITNSLNNSDYLNNEREEQMFFTGTFVVSSTIGVYQMKGDMERLFIKEPLGVPITISMVCHNQESTLGILYQYALPEPNTPSSIPSYRWEFLNWEKCPFPCGGGAQRAIAVCVEAQGGEVEDCYCSMQNKPPDKVRVCNRHPCEARWWVGPWANCDCFHQEGITTRMVMCAYLKEARSNYIRIVPEAECVNSPKPRTEKPCDPLKDKKTWEVKEHTTKRDLMDMIPYSEAADNYSVCYGTDEDEYPNMVNVQEKFINMDPEKVTDYAYLKKIGMTMNLWEKMQNSRQSGGRIRRRKRKVMPSSTPITKAKTTEEKKPKKVTGKTEKPSKSIDEGTTIASATSKKYNTDVTGRRYVTDDHTTKKFTDKNPSTTSKRIPKTEKAMLTSQAVIETTLSTKKITNTEELTTVKQKSLMTSTKGAGTTLAITKKPAGTIPAIRKKLIINGLKQFTRKDKSGTATIRATTSRMVTNTKGSFAVKPKALTEKKSAGTTPTDTKPTTNVQERTAKLKESLPNNAVAATKIQTGVTVPQVLSCTIVRGYSMYASEAPIKQKKCWQIEMEKSKETTTSTSSPAEDAILEPAEAAPEMDFMNTSNIKIFIVPIETTIRTIIQNDEEFIVIETLAKYPIGDELNVVEHWGDAARRELKLAREKQQSPTEHFPMQD